MQEMGSLVAEVVMVLAVLWAWFGKFLWAYAQEKAFKDMVSFSFTRRGQVQNIIDKALEETGCLTADLIYANNGGAIANGMGPVYTSIFVNASMLGEDEAKSTRKAWQGQELEDIYHEHILKPLFNGKHIHIRKDDLPEGDLKNMYTRRGIETVIAERVKFSNGKLWLCSLKYNRDLSEDEVKVALDIAREASLNLKKIVK